MTILRQVSDISARMLGWTYSKILYPRYKDIFCHVHSCTAHTMWIVLRYYMGSSTRLDATSRRACIIRNLAKLGSHPTVRLYQRERCLTRLTHALSTTPNRTALPTPGDYYSGLQFFNMKLRQIISPWWNVEDYIWPLLTYFSSSTRLYVTPAIWYKTQPHKQPDYIRR